MYGKPVTITELRAEGMAPDGTARPGADLEFMVLFDEGEAGCSTTGSTDGFCNPGADISWYLNGTFVDSNPWTGYNGSLGGYVATHGFVAPMSGSVTVMAKSLNTVTFPTVTVSATDTDAGIAYIEDVLCGDNPNYACGCESGMLKIWYTVDKAVAGNGMAYVDVLIDGNVIAENIVVSLGSRGRMYYSTPCPSSSVAHTITVRAVGGNSDTVTLPAGGAGGGGYNPPVDTGDGGYNPPDDTWGGGYNPPDTGGGGYIPPDIGGGSDITKSIISFYEGNKLLAIGGVALLGGLVWFTSGE